jgi:hypothetical protein
MRQQVYIGRSILTRPRSSRASAIVRFGLSIAIAGICACHHSEPASSTANPIAGRWQAEIPSPVGLQQCVMEIGDMGQIAYGDSCPMPLTGQQATVTTVPNGAYAPNLYVGGKDSGTFMIMGGSGITGMVGAFRVEGSKHLETRTAPGADIEWTRSSSQGADAECGRRPGAPGASSMAGERRARDRAASARVCSGQMAAGCFSDLDPNGADNCARQCSIAGGRGADPVQLLLSRTAADAHLHA